jgi:cobalt-zinc-cadmium efflux system protein
MGEHLDEDEHCAGGHHAHGRAPDAFGRAFAIGIALNSAYVLFEAAFGIWGNSLALLADAGHNFGDVLALTAAWGASALGRMRPTARYTYGFRRTTIFAALGNAIMLLMVTGGIAWESIQRLVEQETAAGGTMMIVAGIGIVVNGATALLFMSGRNSDINMRAAFAHMAADALIALGVVVSGGLILGTGWYWVDPASGLIVSALIVRGTWSLLRESLNLAMDAVPVTIEAAKVERYLAELPGVTAVHDLHIWAMSTTEIALTAHLVRPGAATDDMLLARVATDLKEMYGIGHATLQIESGEHGCDCQLKPADVV